MFNMKPAGPQRLAVALAYAYMRMFEVERPIDKKVAAAKFDGMTRAANAVGYGRTETEVYHVVMNFIDGHPKPMFNATSGKDRIAWEDAAAEILGGVLEAIK